jgi:methyltransferase (TIGR00027 family)
MTVDELGRRVLSLSDVASTGLLTAFCHAVESRSQRPLLVDPLAEAIADRLRPALAASPLALHQRLAAGTVRPSTVHYLAIRARRYDYYAREFVRRPSGGCVVNLGCGLDTRFRRIGDGAARFYDLDLPEVIELKRELVEESDRYRMVASSVLDRAWMDRLAARGQGPLLFLAEGLMMYLRPQEVLSLVAGLRQRFEGAELVFETVSALSISPWLKWLTNRRMLRALDLGKGAEFRFGMRRGSEVEGWAPGVRLLEEWTCGDEAEAKVGWLRRHVNWKLFRHVQWTVRCRLGVGASERSAGA